MRGIKAIGYCSSWDSDCSEKSIDDQVRLIHEYAERKGLIIQDFVMDGDPSNGRVFTGFDHISSMISSHQVDHIIVTGVDRICFNSSQVAGFLGRFIDSHTALHIIDWHVCSTDLSYKFLVRSLIDIQKIDLGPAALDTGKLRSLELWRKVYEMITSEVYAGHLIDALFRTSNIKFASREEIDAVHSGYDHMQLFSVLGCRIKGEATNNTWLVADVITRNWDKIRRVIDQRIVI